MAGFNSELAAIRFGCGLSPVVDAPRSVDTMLQGLQSADAMAQTFPIESFDTFRETRMKAVAAQRKILKENRGSDIGKAARKQRNVLNRIARTDKGRWLGQNLLRRSYTEQGFFERLAFFWGDHFSAQGKQGLIRRATSPYIEDAIRPNMTGQFADLLKAAVLHPLMLTYLDQHRSVGPNSAFSMRKTAQGKAAGLNENLAREVLELHTLGVNGPYTQTDVTQLAELFTGLTFQVNVGFKFRKDMVEPGAETVLGKTYGDQMNRAPVLAVLDDLAVHPATASHVAWKLAMHFVSDTPDPALIDHVAAAFQATDGNLMAVYTALLDHPAAWQTDKMNFKFPVDFVGSACRALAIPPAPIQAFDEKGMQNAISTPMTMMGQNWQLPIGPDGWPEEDSEWITPQGLSGRVRWAMAVPQVLQPALPDPREFVDAALGSFAPDAVRFAASAAESKTEAIGLVLASPAFQRR
ncbi:DUF1800 domain-containing protein [Ascidiaceihabitans sp.]|uniref:DUF1800 domain-containing protein n=1 Tax=Ascidiaceihabitans sp. TaxID=1872644 RepID=UPI003296A30A